jgi:hypothetical protein
MSCGVALTISFAKFVASATAVAERSALVAVSSETSTRL